MRELPEPDGFRTRYRSEPGMMGHYPWAYADKRWKGERKEHESEDLFTRDQVLAIQKQAYEDGLRDALEAVNTTILPITLQAEIDSMARTARDVCADAVRDLLTASQKAPQ